MYVYKICYEKYTLLAYYLKINNCILLLQYANDFLKLHIFFCIVLKQIHGIFMHFIEFWKSHCNFFFEKILFSKYSL